MFDTKSFESKMSQAISHFEDELRKLRTGRAHPDMLNGILVDAYGSKVPLNQVATITIPEPQQIQVAAFDQANVKSVVEAIRNDQALGFNPSDDGRVVRISVPPLTEERRRGLVKQLGEKVEEARITLRTIRQDALKAAKSAKEAKELSEDDVKRIEKDVDRLMGDTQGRLDSIARAKEQEIMTI